MIEVKTIKEWLQVEPQFKIKTAISILDNTWLYRYIDGANFKLKEIILAPSGLGVLINYVSDRIHVLYETPTGTHQCEINDIKKHEQIGINWSIDWSTYTPISFKKNMSD